VGNPATLTINDLAANGSIAQPAGQTIDTNGTVPIAAGSVTGRLVIEVINGSAAALTVKVKAGFDPPATAAGQGDLSVALSASGGGSDKKLIGPFESARFVKADGTLDVNFTAASGAPAATVRVYRLPKTA